VYLAEECEAVRKESQNRKSLFDIDLTRKDLLRGQWLRWRRTGEEGIMSHKLLRNVWTKTCVVLLVLLSTSLLEAQQTRLKRIYQGTKEAPITAIQIRGMDVLVFGPGGLRSTLEAGTIKTYDAPEAAKRGLALKSNQRLVTSADGTQAGRITYTAVQERQLRVTFELLRNGQSAWQVQSEGPTNFYVSNDGNTVVAVKQDIHAPQDTTLTIYSQEGQVLGRVEQPLIRTTQVASDGTVVVVNTGSDGLLVFNRRGVRQYKLPASNDFRVSADGKTIASFQPNAVILYRQGEEAGRIITKGIARDVALTARGEYAAAIDKTTLYVYDLTNKALLFTKSTAGKREEYRSVDIAPDATAVIAGKLTVRQRRTRNKSGSAVAWVELLSKDGTLRHQESFTPASWNRFSPAVRFLAKGASALIRSRDTVYVIDTVQ
jgi:hypothetical protein